VLEIRIASQLEKAEQAPARGYDMSWLVITALTGIFAPHDGETLLALAVLMVDESTFHERVPEVEAYRWQCIQEVLRNAVIRWLAPNLEPDAFTDLVDQCPPSVAVLPSGLQESNIFNEGACQRNLHLGILPKLFDLIPIEFVQVGLFSVPLSVVHGAGVMDKVVMLVTGASQKVLFPYFNIFFAVKGGGLKPSRGVSVRVLLIPLNPFIQF
jgi:hypothetical protein